MAANQAMPTCRYTAILLMLVAGLSGSLDVEAAEKRKKLKIKLVKPQVEQPASPTPQQATATDGGTAINIARDLIINKNNYNQSKTDPKVLKKVEGIDRKIDQLAAESRGRAEEDQREKLYQEKIKQLERDNTQLKDDRDQAIARVVEAAEKPNASPEVKQAEAALQRGDTAAAEALFQQAETAAAKSAEDQRKLAARAARYQGSLAYAFDTKKALASYRRAAEYEPDDVDTWGIIGDLALRAGQTELAAEAYATMARLADNLPASDTTRRARAVAHSKIGDVLVAQGDLPAALSSYRDGLKIGQTLAAKDAGNSEWQRDLFVSFIRIAEVLVQENNRGEALQYFDKGLGIPERLTKLDPSNTVWKKDLAWIKNRIAELKE